MGGTYVEAIATEASHTLLSIFPVPKTSSFGLCVSVFKIWCQDMNLQRVVPHKGVWRRRKRLKVSGRQPDSNHRHLYPGPPHTDSFGESVVWSSGLDTVLFTPYLPEAKNLLPVKLRQLYVRYYFEKCSWIFSWLIHSWPRSDRQPFCLYFSLLIWPFSLPSRHSCSILKNTYM